MMQPRCAVCDGDNDVMTLCDAHSWLTHVYALVYTGGWSDWPLPDYCEYGPLVSQRQMMTSNAIAAARAAAYDDLDARLGGIGLARDIRLSAELLTVLEGAGAEMDTRGYDSLGDSEAVATGKAPQWVLDELDTVARDVRLGRARRNGKGRAA